MEPNDASDVLTAIVVAGFLARGDTRRWDSNMNRKINEKWQKEWQKRLVQRARSIVDLIQEKP